MVVVTIIIYYNMVDSVPHLEPHVNEYSTQFSGKTFMLKTTILS